jgi:hypothetical protein
MSNTMMHCSPTYIGTLGEHDVTNCATEKELRRIIRDAGFRPRAEGHVGKDLLPELAPSANPTSQHQGLICGPRTD